MLAGGEVDTLVAARTRSRQRLAAAPTTRTLGSVIAEIELQQRSLVARGGKRAIDVVGAAIGLILLAPIFAICAVAVR